MRLAHHRSLGTAVAAAMALTIALGWTVRAQEPAADAFCALFTTEEVLGVLGAEAGPDAEVTTEPGLDGCGWTYTTTDGQVASASVGWAGGDLDDQKAVWPDGTELSVGGQAAYMAPGIGTLFVEAGGGVLMLTAFAFGGDLEQLDLEAAVTALGELAVARAADLPSAPTPVAVPSFEADPELEALFPDTIGGQPLSVESMAGSQIAGSAASEGFAAVQATLDAQGKTLDDVSAAFAFTSDAAASIIAIRVAGGDAAPVAQALLTALSGGQDFEAAPGDVAGRDVTVLSTDDGSTYLYVNGDVAWFVDAEEPALSEIIGALP